MVERNLRKIRIGVVTSDKMDKTITVLVEPTLVALGGTCSWLSWSWAWLGHGILVTYYHRVLRACLLVRSSVAGVGRLAAALQGV